VCHSQEPMVLSCPGCFDTLGGGSTACHGTDPLPTPIAAHFTSLERRGPAGLHLLAHFSATSLTTQQKLIRYLSMWRMRAVSVEKVHSFVHVVPEWLGVSGSVSEWLRCTVSPKFWPFRLVAIKRAAQPRGEGVQRNGVRRPSAGALSASHISP
jgi:hypothetical protein